MLSPRQFYQLTRQSVSAWSDDYAPSMGAAIAYYTIFSLAPLLLLVIAVAGMIFGREAVQGEIVGQIMGLVGKEGAVAIEGLIASASKPATSAVATIVSFSLVLLGATSVFAEIQNAMDRIWRVPAAKRPGSAFDFIRTRVLSFGLILGLAFLLLVSLVVSAGVTALGTWWGAYFKGWETVLLGLNTATSLLFSAILFGMIYKLLPRPRIAWREVWTGALVTAALFEVGKFGIGLYLGKSGVSSGFGAAGSLVVLLIWIYYSAQIFLLGAEFTHQYILTHGVEAAADTLKRRAKVERIAVPSTVRDRETVRNSIRYEDHIHPVKETAMFFSSRVDPVSTVPSAVASGTETAAQKLGKAAAAVGLAGNAAALLRRVTGRRGMLSIPVLGLVAAIGVIAAMKFSKDAKAKKAAEQTVPSSYPEGAVGVEPTPELKPYAAEGR